MGNHLQKVKLLAHMSSGKLCATHQDPEINGSMWSTLCRRNKSKLYICSYMYAYIYIYALIYIYILFIYLFTVYILYIYASAN